MIRGMQALIPSEPAPSVRLADAADVTADGDELVVQVEAISVNRGETLQLESVRPGWRPGKDIAGRVLQAAQAGRGPREGERVVAHLDGAGWAQRAVAPLDRVAVLPDEVDTATAAALPLAGLTALRLLRTAGPVSGQRVLLTGASGGVGHYFVELAAAQGADVTVVVGTPARAERLLELGATRAVGSVAEAGGPFDVGLDSVGGDTTQAVLRTLATHGRLVWFGQASRKSPTLDFFDWSGGAMATISKFHYLDDPAPVADDLAALVRLTATGRLHPEIGLRDTWERADSAMAALLDRRVRGNVVLDVA
jgi:NADPH:quinone reductase-like Zn-dependent oxidoreductase